MPGSGSRTFPDTHFREESVIPLTGKRSAKNPLGRWNGGGIQISDFLLTIRSNSYTGSNGRCLKLIRWTAQSSARPNGPDSTIHPEVESRSMLRRLDIGQEGSVDEGRFFAKITAVFGFTPG